MNSVAHGCERLVNVCADLQPGEKTLIVSDQNTQQIGEAIARVARHVTSLVTHRVIPAFTMHGQEPPEDVAGEMIESDVIFGVTKMSMAHTHGRERASLAGARYLSLPDYSMELLSSPALQVNFRDLTSPASRIADILTAGHEVRLTTELGTSIVFQIDDRQANCCPGWCMGPGSLASPPDAETNIAPIEHLSEGIVVVDGSIPCVEIGLLEEPITLGIVAGRIDWIKGGMAERLEQVLEYPGHPKTRVLAELGIGLNPKAQLCGRMLEDEGSLGTVHLGFGSNTTIGGCNKVPFHLDTVIKDVSLTVDDKIVIESGRLMI